MQLISLNATVLAVSRCAACAAEGPGEVAVQTKRPFSRSSAWAPLRHNIRHEETIRVCLALPLDSRRACSAFCAAAERQVAPRRRRGGRLGAADEDSER